MYALTVRICPGGAGNNNAWLRARDSYPTGPNIGQHSIQRNHKFRVDEFLKIQIFLHHQFRRNSWKGSDQQQCWDNTSPDDLMHGKSFAAGQKKRMFIWTVLWTSSHWEPRSCTTVQEINIVRHYQYAMIPIGMKNQKQLWNTIGNIIYLRLAIHVVSLVGQLGRGTGRMYVCRGSFTYQTTQGRGALFVIFCTVGPNLCH